MDHKYFRVRYSLKDIKYQLQHTITSKTVYFAGILIIYFLLRITYITADPIYISWSYGAYTDIGYYASNVKSLIVSGKNIIGDWDNRLLFPAYHYIILGWSKVMGLSYYSLNLMAIIFSLLTMLVLTYYKKSKKYKFFILLLTSINFISVSTSRVAYLENISLLFLVLSAYFVRHLNLASIILSAVFAGIAVLTKTNALFIFPAIIIFLSILAFTHRIKLWKYYMFCFVYLIIIIIILSYYFIALELYDVSIVNYTLLNKTSSGFSNPLKNMLNLLHTNYFARIPVICASATAYIYYFIFEKKKLDFSDLIMSLWILSFIIQQSFFSYNPMRYYQFFLPPLIFFSSKFFGYYFEFIKKILLLKKTKIIIVPAIYFAAYYSVWIYNRSIMDRHFIIKFFSYDISMAIIYILEIIIAIWLFLKFVKYSEYVFYYILIVCFVCFSGYQFYKYHYSNISYDMKNISFDLEKILAKENLIAGWFAPQLCLNNNLKSLPSYNMSEQYLKNNGATHLILEGEKIGENYGNLKLNYVKSYYITKIKMKLNLYEIIN